MSRPTFSLVVVVHAEADRVVDFGAMLRHQTLPADQVEVVAVDTGASPENADVLARWAAEDARVRVVPAPGASLGGARNAGLAATTGRWVSFPRVCDDLHPELLARVADAVAAYDGPVLVSANKLVREHDGRVTDDLPLRMFHRSDRELDLARVPEVIAGDPVSTWFDADLVRAHDVTFLDLWSGTPDTYDFAWRLLLRAGSQRVAMLRKAVYHQFRGQPLSGRLPGMEPPGDEPEPSLRMVREALVGVLDEAIARDGAAPEWLQHQVAYAVARLLVRSDSSPAPGLPVDPAAREELHTLLEQVVARLDVDEVVPYMMGRVRRRTRYALQHGYAEEPWVEATVVLSDLDEEQQLVRASYFFTGDAPTEEFRSEGRTIAVAHGKTQHLYYSGRLLLKHRIAWIPFGGMLEARINGRPRDLTFEASPFPRHRVPQQVATSELRSSGGGPRVISRRGRVARRLAMLNRSTRKYADAWVLMDRIHDAGDNGEALFRHLRRSEPDVNAWFVLEKDSPHWDRLASDGFKDRMVAHGSMEWRVLMSHARHLLSSHADLAVTQPGEVTEITRPDWRFTFLQHGVIMFDLSHWMNAKELDVLVTSTKGEYRSIAGDTSAYDVTTRETVLTGLARWDQLLEKARAVPGPERDLILVAPTWRSWLLPPLVPGTQKRALDLSALDSPFFRSWKAFLTDPRLTALAEQHGLRIGFLPHPNLQPLLEHLELPEHVEPLTYSRHDVQQLLARARVYVTDYSSVAFDAAYADRPVVYHQFDTDLMLGGSHVGNKGYFDFDTDGFGPVAGTLDEAIAAVTEVVEAGPTVGAEYAARADATFPDRDGRCCARIVEAVRTSSRRVVPGTVVPTPEASRPWH